VKLSDVFETRTCPRCGGEGRLIQFSNVIGGQCFRCGGAGRIFTDRGAEDLKRYRDAVDAATLRPVTEVKAGDAVRSRNMKRFVPVVAVSEPRASCFQGKQAVDITLNHPVWHDLGCPLSYKGEEFSIGADELIAVWPGKENMPDIEAFDSRRAVAVRGKEVA
jgi:hypothetical protein